ncbi:hypothetical protein RF11_13755 [Thelohanellus kitauei]|uniref:Uncharacterized protein n=1 Tax=Thelohanellus kitauei TaxID=669202 RepID=A0A0C2J6P2_THEKT|nr:hypothetical protein RF11_13755 [Thelohanellus kitauei]
MNLVKTKPEFSRPAEYKNYKKRMVMTLFIFNKSNYMDKKIADDYVSSCDANSRTASSISNTTENSDTISDIRCIPDTLRHTIMNQYLEFRKIGSWFNLVYEYKFIYGDINSKFTDLKFLSKY